MKSGPAGDVMLVVLIDTVTNNLENGIQMHQEMHRLNLADWNDSGYSSSPIPNKGMSKSNTPMMLEQGKIAYHFRKHDNIEVSRPRYI